MKRVALSRSYLYVGAILVVGCISYAMFSVASQEKVPFSSSELEIATFSPNGAAGGMLVPASGCSGGACPTCSVTVTPSVGAPDDTFTVTVSNVRTGATDDAENDAEGSSSLFDNLGGGSSNENLNQRVLFVRLCEGNDSGIGFSPLNCKNLSPVREQEVTSDDFALGDKYVVYAARQYIEPNCVTGHEGGCNPQLSSVTCQTEFEITDGVLPDLAPQPPIASPNQVKPGDSITFTTLVDNIGATTSDPYDIVFHVDVDGDGVSEYQLDDRETAITLAGAQNSENHTETVPVGAATGTWQVGYFVDTSSEVPESDEDNNWSGWTPFEVIEEDVLIAPSVTLSGSTPVSDGGDTTLTWIIGGGTPESCTPSTEVGGVTDWDTTNTGVIGGGASIGPLSNEDSPYTFRLTCTNAAGTDSDDTTVVVLPPVDGGSGATACIEPELVANPIVVRSGESAEITWENPDTAAICTLYENGVSTGETFGPSVCDDSYTTTVTPTNITEYSLVCTDMIAPDQVPDPITIYVTPNYDQN